MPAKRSILWPATRFPALLMAVGLPDPQTIRGTAVEVLSQSRFQHDQPEESGDLLGLGKLLRRLFGVFDSTAADSPALATLMMLCLFVLVAVLLVYTVRRINWSRPGTSPPSGWPVPGRPIRPSGSATPRRPPAGTITSAPFGCCSARRWPGSTPVAAAPPGPASPIGSI